MLNWLEQHIYTDRFIRSPFGFLGHPLFICWCILPVIFTLIAVGILHLFGLTH